ncbi:MAG: response regulator [Bacteroidota bacterium]
MQKTRNPLIFVIEDTVVFKDLIIGYLKSKKFTNLKTYTKGQDCLKDIHLKPDLIILNYSSEGLTGLELMKKVHEEHPDIDFIFLSGQNNVEVAVKIMKLGAADYIVKNDRAPHNLVQSIEQLVSTVKKEKMAKGFKIGVVGFFVILFIFIMAILLMSIFFQLEF